MKPCLVIGSGFHNWVLGDSNSPLSNWSLLIDKVAQNLALSIPSQSLPPVLRWERLLEIANADGYKHPSKSNFWVNKNTKIQSNIEKDAKKQIALIFENIKPFYPTKSTRASFPLTGIFGAVISLNFDTLWIRDASSLNSLKKTERDSQHSEQEYSRLTNHLTLKSSSISIWFPNGCVLKPNTIRMGLNDFGEQPQSLKLAFAAIKAFEREKYKNSWDDYESVLNYEFSLQEERSDKADPRLKNWVAHFLYRPVYFAGVGLSQSEIGLWWLLSQRARNVSRIETKNIPETIMLNKLATADIMFWSNRPFGIEPLYCDNWDQGWEMLQSKASPQAIASGTF